jgi:hypothetical protein
VSAVAEEFFVDQEELGIEDSGEGEKVVVDVTVWAKGVGAEVTGASEEVASGFGEICDAEPCREGRRSCPPDGGEPADSGIGRREEDAGFVDHAEAGGGYGSGRVLIEGAKAGFDAGGLVEIVGIEDADEIRIGGEGEAAVESVVGTGVLLGEEGDSRIGDGAGGIEGAIGGAVVDDDDAVWGMGLGKEAAERIGNVALVIEEGDDDGDLGHGGRVFRRLTQITQIGE